jgi:hypothetical protein
MFEFLALPLLASVVLGAAIGFLCRGRVRLQIATSIPVSGAWFLWSALSTGTLSIRWPPAEIVNATAYLAVPFLLLFLLPTVITSVVVGQWGKR